MARLSQPPPGGKAADGQNERDGCRSHLPPGGPAAELVVQHARLEVDGAKLRHKGGRGEDQIRELRAKA